jgi:hypothetical protein
MRTGSGTQRVPPFRGGCRSNPCVRAKAGPVSRDRAIRERPTRVGWNSARRRRGDSGPDDCELVAVQLEEIVRRVD